MTNIRTRYVDETFLFKELALNPTILFYKILDIDLSLDALIFYSQFRAFVVENDKDPARYGDDNYFVVS